MVKPSVQVAVEPAVVGEPENDTLVGVVALMVIPADGMAAVVSWEVAMLKPLARYEPAAGFVCGEQVARPDHRVTLSARS